jgi:hypothetical protein
MKPCVGRYVFWTLIIAILVARAIYLPRSPPGTAETFDQAKTEMAR